MTPGYRRDLPKDGHAGPSIPSTQHFNKQGNGQPFPVVQESHDYDKDFVQDLHSDNGEWHAQTEYDRLRRKVIKEKADVAVADIKRKLAKDKLDADKNEEHSADDGARSASERAAAAKKAADEAEAEKHRNSIPGATEHLNDSQANLEKCKENLENAKKRLAELEKMKANGDYSKKEAEAQSANAKAHQDEEEGHKQVVHKQVQTETKEHGDAMSAYEKQVLEVSQAETDLSKAAEELRKYRHEGGGKGESLDGAKLPTGTQYNAQSAKSGATSTTLSALTPLMCLTMLSSWGAGFHP